ncbi:ATP-binding protein [Mesobacillus maritimus]|uniref:AAA family ATPase n=1 Tax=Mesobacillus maritimus TaxID=1643336 RepID=A0ABS7JZ23_9BACI|nr:AAA family ATPase [Mesobacillus maritimus]MBY0095245.1 AAA family ATPase [Mesobacillus maritimus]
MHLKELHIYGYGKLENIKITNLENLQVFYGENEAGKSTIMSFIHSILFGFPTKQQSELRYEPKKNSKYGGLIKASFSDRGMAVIERVKGKATGDVTVTLEDGSVGGEELLNELLNGMDKGTFQSIFSFNLHGLQNIHQLKGEDLGRYLFSAGALGTDKLLSTEKALQKEMEQRFKPGGKRPELNEKLSEIRKVYDALKKAEKENAEYGELLNLNKETNSKLENLANELEETEEKVYQLKKLERVLPLIMEEKQLEHDLHNVGDVPYPVDGLLRLDRIRDWQKPVEARMLWLTEQKDILHLEAEKLKPDANLLAHETEVTAQLEELAIYHQIRIEKEKLQQRVEELDEDIEQMNDQLHTQFNETSISLVNTSVMMKEKAEEIQLKQQQLKDRKQALDENFHDEKLVMEELEKSFEEVKKDLLDKHIKAKLVKQLQTIEQQEKIEAELQAISGQVTLFTTQQRSVEKQKEADQKRQGLFMLMLGVIFLSLIFSGYLTNQWILSIAGGVGFVLTLLMFFRFKPAHSEKTDSGSLKKLKQREQELKTELQDTTGLNGDYVRATIEKDEENRKKYYDLAARIDQQNIRYERVIQAFENWERESRETEAEQEELASSLLLPSEFAKGKIYEAVGLVEKLKQRFREKSRLENRLTDLQNQQQTLITKFQGMAEQFLQLTNIPTPEVAILLKKKLREEIDKQGKYQGIITKLKEINEEYDQLEKELQQFRLEEEKLYELAKVEDEEAFRTKGLKAEQITKWKTRLADISLQLETSEISKSDRIEVQQGKKLNEELQRALKKVEDDKKEQSKLRDTLADIKHRMGLLEEGGLYADLLHRYRQMKYEFEEESKEWAKYALAKEILSKTIQSYKTEAFPKLLSKAGKYFRFLTDEEYLRIIPQESGSGFIIERKDHTLFEANELSQATAEQVYVSLRLALIATLLSRYPFPIIIDDSFVNFDEKRTKKVFTLLRSFTNNQILFFTCHNSILHHFHADELVKLNQNPIQEKIG